MASTPRGAIDVDRRPLLEARHVTKVFGGGCSTRADRGAGRFLVDHRRDRRRRSPPSSARAAAGRRPWRGSCSGSRSRRAARCSTRATTCGSSRRAERRTYLREVQVIFQDPYEVYNPFYNVDHVLETPIRKFGLADSRRARRALIEETLARGRAAARRRRSGASRTNSAAGSASASWSRARCCCSRALIIADEPVSMVDASLRATILNSLRATQPAVRHLADLHHPRSDDGLSDQREHHRALSRRGRRGGQCRAGGAAARSIRIRSCWSARSRCRTRNGLGGGEPAAR